jgi:hypothetical protein
MITHTYPEAAKEYNVAQIGKFTQVRGEYQACRVAFFHGFGSGVYYGGAIGLASAIYKRQMRILPATAIPMGLVYGTFLAGSAFYRFDL